MIGMEQGRGGDVALRSVGWGAGLPQLWSCLLPSPASIKKKKSKKKIETIFYPERLRQQEANAVISLVSREIKSGRLGAAWLRHHLAVIPPCVPGARHPEEPVFPMELPGPPATLQQLVISRTTPWFCFAVCDVCL